MFFGYKRSGLWAVFFPQGVVWAVVFVGFQAVIGSVQAQTVATPVFSQTSGQAEVQFYVTVTDSTSGATIYYTLDGTTPTTSSATVASGGTILISQSETLQAYATASGYTQSAVASATYTITGQVSVGQIHTVALKSDGTVWTWGGDNVGQLGNGSTTERHAPAKLTSLSGMVQVAAGEWHTLALNSDGTVWSWGYNQFGELGTMTIRRSRPTR